jgi:trimeric autotransporter adhesin
MKKILTFLFIILVGGVLTTNLFGQPNTVSLTVAGSSIGTYSSIGGASGAWAALKLLVPITGPAVIELSGYDGSLEPATANPIVSLDAISGASATNTITIRPASGQTIVSYTTLNANFFKFQNGATYIILDGRAGGTGSSRNWTIQTRSLGTSATAIYFADAQYCTIQYCTIQAEIVSQTAGVIRFTSATTAGVSKGINNCKILHCDISSYDDGTGLNFSRTGLYSVGSLGFESTNNEVGYCNFHDFWNTSSIVGILLRDYSSSWNIHDNSFYMTTEKSLTGTQWWGAISLDKNLANGIQFTNNYIGGTAPECGGSAMSLIGDGQLTPIRFSSATTPFSKNTVTGNTIKNISFVKANSSGGTSSLIQLNGGDFNDVIGNVIENITGTFSLGLHTLRGIEVTTVDATTPFSISQNKITGLNTSGTAVSSSIDGIYVSGTGITISNNMINLGAGTTMDAAIRGIYIANTTTANTANVYFNTVNIYGTTSGSSNSYAFGRVNTGVTGSVVIKDNILYNTRSGGTGKNAGIVSTTSGLTSDYNNIFTGNALTLGSVDGGTTFTNFSDWKTNSGQDANSSNTTVAFVSSTDLHLAAISKLDVSLHGTTIAGITTDFDGDTRSLTIPFMGADEPQVSTLSLTAFIQGYMNLGGTAMVYACPVTVELHNSNAPYALVETSTGTLSTAGTATISFVNALNGTSYYVVVKSWNTLETWSSAAVSFAPNATYNFTSAAAQAYASNMIQIGTKWCIYSGDVNQDGFINSYDFSPINNDSYGLVHGVVVTDLTGDQFTNSFDFSIVNNNSYGLVKAHSPILGNMAVTKPLIRKIKNITE